LVSLCSEFFGLLNNICSKKKHDGLLLSGGLDSSILAYHLKPDKAITIIVDNPDNSKDYFYSNLIAEKNYVDKHFKIIISFEEILSNIEALIKDYKTFDPIFLKNSVVQLSGFQWAKKLNMNSVVVGDGADELFAGYNFLHKYIEDKKKITDKIESIIQNMNFFSEEFSKKIGLRIFLPYLEDEMIGFSKKIPLDYKIAKHEGELFGKYFMRKCYEDILGKEIVWRKKMALQDGSGAYKLENYIENNIIKDDIEFNKQIEKIRLAECVEIRSKEHLYFYRIYRKYYKPPINEIENFENIKKCKYCNSLFRWSGNFCKVCGGFPVF
jgi:asparagine synthase (glutamine-hydrolysing)